MAKLVITTQYMENYDVDQVTEEGHWKYKGGHDFIIDNVDVNNVQSVVAEITPLIEYDNSMSREYILNWTVESDDWVPQYEKSQKEWYDGQMYYEPRLFKNEDGHWIKIRKFDGERGGYEYHDNLNTEEVIHKYEYTKEVAA
tara:strand:+ start:336 stop:761 length:426 start_codon:yes stop_codon:yes gene_type:complete